MRMCYKVDSKYSNPNKEQEELVRPNHVSDHATFTNIGFIDSPVYVWIEYVGNLQEHGEVFNHIAGFKFTYDSGQIDTSYYESKGRGIFDLDTNNYEMLLYPGDATMKLTHGTQEKLIFHVLEIEDDDLEWRRVYKVALNNRNELVSNDVTLIKFEWLMDNKEVNVKFKDEKGFREFVFVSTDNFPDTPKVTYLDKSSGTIFLLGKNDKLVIKNEDNIPLL